MWEIVRQAALVAPSRLTHRLVVVVGSVVVVVAGGGAGVVVTVAAGGGDGGSGSRDGRITVRNGGRVLPLSPATMTATSSINSSMHKLKLNDKWTTSGQVKGDVRTSGQLDKRLKWTSERQVNRCFFTYLEKNVANAALRTE